MPRPITITFNEPLFTQRKPSSVPRVSSLIEDAEYILMPRTNPYTLGVHALQDACAKDVQTAQPQFEKSDGSLIYRPLRFKENIEARVADYETLRTSDGTGRKKEERLRLFTMWLDSCCGITYQGGTNKFKLILECPELILIDHEFAKTHLPVAYSAIEGIELERDSTYRRLLSKNEVLEHAGWRATVEDDVPLLTTYRDIIFAELKVEQAMGFWLLESVAEDQLRALFVNDLDYNSNAVGNSDLSNCGSFLQVAQRPRPQGAKNGKGLLNNITDIIKILRG